MLTSKRLLDIETPVILPPKDDDSCLFCCRSVVSGSFIGKARASPPECSLASLFFQAIPQQSKVKILDMTHIWYVICECSCRLYNADLQILGRGRCWFAFLKALGTWKTSKKQQLCLTVFNTYHFKVPKSVQTWDEYWEWAFPFGIRLNSCITWNGYSILKENTDQFIQNISDAMLITI